MGSPCPVDSAGLCFLKIHRETENLFKFLVLYEKHAKKVIMLKNKKIGSFRNFQKKISQMERHRPAMFARIEFLKKY